MILPMTQRINSNPSCTDFPNSAKTSGLSITLLYSLSANDASSLRSSIGLQQCKRRFSDSP
ncbi:hypothetical protein ACHAXS_007622, partial [Conticribra weissflogii]